MAGSVGKGGTRGTPEQGQRAYESEKAQMKEFQDYMNLICLKNSFLVQPWCSSR